jgi:hypothetical protein
MKNDPAIERTRRARLQISNAFGNDPTKLVQYYIEMQKRFGARVRGGPTEGAEQGLPPDAQKDARG